MRDLRSLRDHLGNNLDGIEFTDHVDIVALTAATAKDYTVPAGAKYILMQSLQNFYCSKDRTATIPSGDVTDGTGAILNPLLRVVAGGEVVSFICDVNAYIIISVYS